MVCEIPERVNSAACTLRANDERPTTVLGGPQEWIPASRRQVRGKRLEERGGRRLTVKRGWNEKGSRMHAGGAWGSKSESTSESESGNRREAEDVRRSHGTCGHDITQAWCRFVHPFARPENCLPVFLPALLLVRESFCLLACLLLRPGVSRCYTPSSPIYFFILVSPPGWFCLPAQHTHAEIRRGAASRRRQLVIGMSVFLLPSFLSTSVFFAVAFQLSEFYFMWLFPFSFRFQLSWLFLFCYLSLSTFSRFGFFCFYYITVVVRKMVCCLYWEH